ncbi:MAG TPA: coenzyme F420-0:L-glutamate ligase, partial [Anaerolineales bacterium]|nr:coenzyme F420-0:L-glutamate ligase [Anaerolineales bacterium]
MSLLLNTLPGIPFIRRGDNLADILLNSLHSAEIELQNEDILVLAQKIISKTEGRMVNLASVQPSLRAVEIGEQADKDPRLVELMLQESNEVLRVRKGVIVVEHKLGFVCANAGIDHSNVKGEGDSSEDYVLLLPQDPDVSARNLREEIKSKAGRSIGVMIIDS